MRLPRSWPETSAACTESDGQRCTPNTASQKWFDPWLQARDVTELVRHARAHAEEFEQKVQLLAEASELSGKQLTAWAGESLKATQHRSPQSSSLNGRRGSSRKLSVAPR